MNTTTSAAVAGEAPASVTGPAATVHAGMAPGVKITYLVLLVLAIAAPLVGLYPVFVMKALCFALFACAFNLLLGFTGLLSFGHAAFFGFASYVTGYCVKSMGWTPELAVIAGIIVAAFLGLIFGLVAIRRQGIYF